MGIRFGDRYKALITLARYQREVRKMHKAYEALSALSETLVTIGGPDGSYSARIAIWDAQAALRAVPTALLSAACGRCGIGNMYECPTPNTCPGNHVYDNDAGGWRKWREGDPTAHHAHGCNHPEVPRVDLAVLTT